MIDQKILDEVSSIVADIANQRQKEAWHEEDMEVALANLSPEEQKQAFSQATCSILCVAMPGYMPESDNSCCASGDSILDAVLEEINMSDNSDDEESGLICEEARSKARSLGEKLRDGAIIELPDGYNLEISKFSCAEILSDMDIKFDFLEENKPQM